MPNDVFPVAGENQVVIDVAKESSVQKLLDRRDSSGGYFQVGNAVVTDELRYFTSEEAWGLTSQIVWFRGNLYLITKGYDGIYKCEKGGIYRAATLPMMINDIREINLLVYKDRIHLIGGTGGDSKSHYCWDGKTWKIASTLPIPFTNGRAVAFNDEIHIIGGGTVRCTEKFSENKWINKHYRWDGETWREASTLPSDYITFGACLFVYKDCLHVIGGAFINDVDYTKKHYRWDRTSWSTDTELPESRFNASAVTIKHNDSETTYIMNGRVPTSESNNTTVANKGWTLTVDSSMNSVFKQLPHGNPKSCTPDSPNSICVYKNTGTDVNDVVIVGGHIYHYSPSGWVNLYGVNDFNGGTIVGYENFINIFNGKTHYKYNTNQGLSVVSTSDYDFSGAKAVVMDDGIHLLGNKNESFADYHRLWTGTEWVTLPPLPIKMTNCAAAVFKGELHVINIPISKNNPETNYNYDHFKFINNTWVPVSKLYMTDETIECLKNMNFDTCLTSFNGLLYTIVPTRYDTEDHQLDISLLEFDGIRWKLNVVVKSNMIASTTEDLSKHKQNVLLVYNNALQWIESYEESDGRMVQFINTFMIDKNSSSSTKTVIHEKINDNLAYVDFTEFNNSIRGVCSRGLSYCSIIELRNRFKNLNVLTMNIPKGYTLLCDKTKFYPLDTMTPVSNGFKSPETKIYRVYRGDENASFSIC